MLVYLISSDSELSKTLASLIDYTGGNTCRTFKKPLEIMMAVKTQLPDIVITGLRLNEIDGIKLIAILREKNPSLKLMVCASTIYKMEVFRAFAAGASGYISKKEAPACLIDSLASMLKGETVVCKTVKNILTEFFKSNPDLFLTNDLLTHNEQKILDLLAEGLTKKEIATALNISQDTVKTHSSNIFKKLKVNNKTAAVKKILSGKVMKI
jgi:DNA-binding NarL/FixJ family response regulator